MSAKSLKWNILQLLGQNSTLTNRGGLLVNGVKYTDRTFKASFYEIIGEGLATKHLLEKKGDLSDTSQIFNELKANLERDKADKVKDREQREQEQFTDMNLVACLEVTDASQFLVSANTGKVSEVNLEALRLFSKSMHEEITSDIMLCKTVYDPYIDFSKKGYHPLKEMIHIEDFKEVNLINKYTPPYWRTLPVEDILTPPHIFHRFLSHLFSDECSEFVLDWLYTCIMRRNETYMVMNGGKGIGKGLFASIAAALVGAENYSLAPESLLTNHFNVILECNRLIYMDEKKVTRDNKDIYKRYVNEDQNLEAKNKDATKTITTYNSFIISNNGVEDVFLESDERRFSVMDMTNKKALGVFKEEELHYIAELSKHPKDKELIKFGNYVLQRGEKRHKKGLINPFTAFKGDHYKLLEFKSLAKWKQSLIECCLESDLDALPMGKVKAHYENTVRESKNYISWTNIEKFLADYKYLGKCKVGTLESRGKNKDIRLTEEFLEYRDSLNIEEDLI